jgi:hypothetical protein
MWFGFELVNFLLLSYTPQASGKKQHINPPIA